MEKLGASQIPVAGSDAAQKRKQQLEFQVPPHDLDAALCDNLTDTEAQQLQQYVQKLREQCVGQGIVVRVGRLTHGQVEHIVPPQLAAAPTPAVPEAARKVFHSLGVAPVADATLNELLTNPKLANALSQQGAHPQPKLLVAFSEPLSDSTTEFDAHPALRAETKVKLLGISKPSMQSLVTHGVIYDKLLGSLKVRFAL